MYEQVYKLFVFYSILVILIVEYDKTFKQIRVNTLLMVIGVSEQTKAEKEILEQMPEWFRILRESLRKHQDDVSSKEVMDYEH